MTTKAARTHGVEPEKKLQPEQILGLIEDWLSNAGAVEFSLRSAAKAAGINPMALLRHFGGRDGLLEALVRHRIQRDLNTLRSHIGTLGSISEVLRSASQRAKLPSVQRARLLLHITSLSQTAKAPASWCADVYTQLVHDIGALIEADGVQRKKALEIAHFLAESGIGYVAVYSMTENREALQANYRTLHECALSLIERARHST